MRTGRDGQEQFIREWVQAPPRACVVDALQVERARLYDVRGLPRERLEPEFWRPVVERACDDRAFARVWKRARGGGPEARAQLTALLDAAMRGCLTDLYPGAGRFLGPGRPD